MGKICCTWLLLIVGLPAGMIDIQAQPGPLRGKIIDEVTGRSVEFGVVLNYSRHITIYSSATGEFYIPANSGDTLVFSAIGYYYKRIVVGDSLLSASRPVTFEVSPRAFEIGEAKIVALGTYDDFRHDFVNLDKPKTQTELLTGRLAEWSEKAANEGYQRYQENLMRDGGNLLSVPIRSRDEKERLALAKNLEKEEVRNRIYQKFNPEVVKEVTGMTEDHEIIEFMVFCDFADQYVLDINQYNLMEQIALRYELFKKKKRAEQSGENPVNLKNDPDNPNA